MTRRHVHPVLVLALALGAGACEEGDVCEDLGSCGGDPVGAWTYAGAPCQADLYEPPQEIWLFGRPVPVARQAQPEPAHSDWCRGLVYKADATVANYPLFWAESPPYGDARIRYEADGSYNIGLTRTGIYTLGFSSACMRQYGAQASCADLQAPLALSGANDGSFTNVLCAEGSEAGSCDCTFELVAVSTDRGVWSAQGNEIVHRTTSPAAGFPSTATFCQQGDLLELSGARTTSLYNKSGLRTMSLQRVNCTDGVQGPGETGVDCGQLCPTLCAN